MKASGALATVFVVAVIMAMLAVVVLSQPSQLATTGVRVTTTVANVTNTKVTGNCTTVSYFEGDEEEISLSNVTVTSGNVTIFSLSTSVISPMRVTTLGTQTYPTTFYTNDTATFAFTTTSYDLAYAPNGAWTVTTCTYSR